LASEAGLPFAPLAAQGYDRSNPLSLLRALVVAALSTIRAMVRILADKPDVVVAFGGYVCVPVGLAAALTRTPLVLHEQNSVPGLVNRILARYAAVLALTYPGASEKLVGVSKVIVTGNPVRPAVLSADRVQGRRSLGIPDDSLVLLIFGGSRGARRINEVAVEAAEQLLQNPDVHIVHITGKGAEHDSVVSALRARGVSSKRYKALDYIDDMGSALAAADLVVSRAGATSIAEITALGRPAILVPYPYATEDHQTLNASAVADAGGAILIPDKELNPENFVETVTSILFDPVKRANMSAASRSFANPHATRLLADTVIAVASKRKRL